MKEPRLSGSIFLAALSLAIPRTFFARPQSPPAPASAGTRVNVNTASEAELRTLPGVGREEASRIIAGRPYRNLPELRQRAKLPKTIQDGAIAGRITFGGGPAESATQPPIGRPVIGTSSPPPPEPRPAPPANRADRLDVNLATREQLEAIPGLGAVNGARVLHARPFKSLADLKRAGLSRQQIESLSPYIRVGPTGK